MTLSADSSVLTMGTNGVFKVTHHSTNGTEISTATDDKALVLNSGSTAGLSLKVNGSEELGITSTTSTFVLETPGICSEWANGIS